MSLFRKEKTYTGSQVEKALEESNPYAFREAVKEVYDGVGGSVFVMSKESRTAAPSRRGEVPIADVHEDPTFLQTVQDRYKDGLYVLRIFYKDGKFHSDHIFQLGKRVEARKRSEDGEEKKTSRKDDSYIELVKILVEKSSGGGIDTQAFLQMQQAASDRALEMQQRFMEMQQASSDRALEMQSKNHEMMMTLMQGSGSSGLDDAVAILQLSREMQPQIEKDDPLTSIVTSLAPVVGQLLAARKAGANGDVQKYDGQLRQLLAKAAAAGVVAPGTTPAPMAGTESPQPQPPGATHVAPSDHIPEDTSAPVNPRTQEYFNERYIEPFRQDVADGIDEGHLAYQIIAMSQYARDRMPGSPPALVEGFLTSGGLSEYEAALKGFFAAIPELSSLPQKQEAIKAALIQMLMGSGPSMPKPEEDINVIDGDTSIIQDTHSAEGTTVQDQTDDQGDSSEVVNEDVSG